MTREFKFNDHNYIVTFDVVPNMDGNRSIIYLDADTGTAEHRNVVTNIATEKNIIPVDDFFELANAIREIESKTIIQVVDVCEITKNHDIQHSPK